MEDWEKEHVKTSLTSLEVVTKCAGDLLIAIETIGILESDIIQRIVSHIVFNTVYYYFHYYYYQQSHLSHDGYILETPNIIM